MLKISDSISTHVLSLLVALSTFATLSAREAVIAPPDSTATASGFKMVDYAKDEKTTKAVPLFSGYGIYADLCGAVMAQFMSWGQYEAGAHFGIRGRYFPVIELGLGRSDATDSRTHLHHETTAPYFRVGIDYNLNKKNPTSHNRYFVGLRYGFSSYAYDLSGPDIHDNYWDVDVPYAMTGVKGRAQWGELLFGIQTQLWRFIHLGWTVRYKARISETLGTPGHSYYIPGYGRGGTSSSAFGGSFNLIFEL